jgi:hypothetical protein
MNAATVVHGGPTKDGLDVRACALRVENRVSFGIQVRVMDQKTRSFRPTPAALNCNGGPDNCTEIGTDSSSFYPRPVGPKEITAGAAQMYFTQHSAVKYGPHRCVAVAQTLGGGQFVMSPWRLTSELSCPTPSEDDVKAAGYIP